VLDAPDAPAPPLDEPPAATMLPDPAVPACEVVDVVNDPDAPPKPTPASTPSTS
jgi:hypothetical protein